MLDGQKKKRLLIRASCYLVLLVMEIRALQRAKCNLASKSTSVLRVTPHRALTTQIRS